MKTYRLYQIDSFTRERFHGNPAGVIPDAEGLTDDLMQRIAREMNDSETAFVFPPGSPDHDVHVRFFTPETEVPLCGHATIAAHYVLALENGRCGRTIQKTGAGLLPVDTLRDGDDYAIVMTQGDPFVGEPLADDVVSAITTALRITPSDLREDCPLTIASAGHSKIMIGIRSVALLHSLRPDMASLAEISRRVQCNGYYVFTLHPSDAVLVHGRMFAPAIGIAEDPVTGNANGPLGAYLVHFGICRDLWQGDRFDFKILQGEAIRRDGGMTVHVSIKDGRPRQVQITGHAVVAFRTEITI